MDSFHRCSSNGDSLASGDWAGAVLIQFVDAVQLSQVGIQCCAINNETIIHLGVNNGPEEHQEGVSAPSHFKCATTRWDWGPLICCIIIYQSLTWGGGGGGFASHAIQQHSLMCFTVISHTHAHSRYIANGLNEYVTVHFVAPAVVWNRNKLANNWTSIIFANCEVLSNNNLTFKKSYVFLIQKETNRDHGAIGLLCLANICSHYQAY